ncbi:Na+/H+ antiporter NhaA [Crossiella sp. CA-258035]|uniref:Na+/H+ antiporter NhaA n=1 Tax=Crossiella sp. CA-258035 TaxID=2981138 RepID=UPI0024BD31AF|nr:Na+/H+ antiporter NhaA [Crossiella sp. CA-258035]WHT20256.1 Na+/H+ antiporter NhaA [Crossiella sp. CA-258035]
MSDGTSRHVRVFSRASWPEVERVREILRKETVGGALLLVGAVLALVWANSPWAESYAALREIELGPAALHLDLPLHAWAADGLLAIFFFVAGLELKREFVAGDLRDPRRAAVPVAAAVGGVLTPALIFTVTNLGDASALRGWAVPTATDIAFALAVLAVIGHNLPSALRTFLLTLAVVDDLIAIVIIAVFYTQQLSVLPLLLALIPLALFGFLVQRRVRSWWLLLPLAAVTWALVHASGVHATVAGVLLAFTVPVIRRYGEGPGLAEHFERRFRPISAAVVVPVFAFFAAGVTLGGLDGLRTSLSDRVALGIMGGLVLGKVVGITLATFLVSRFTRAELDDDLSWLDVIGLALLGGIGFTVSLLIGELAFDGTAHAESTKVAILAGSVLAALLATAVLMARNREHRRICAAEEVDSDADGIPDVHENDR